MNYCVKYSEVQVQPEWTEKPLCLWETTTMMIHAHHNMFLKICCLINMKENIKARFNIYFFNS